MDKLVKPVVDVVGAQSAKRRSAISISASGSCRVSFSEACRRSRFSDRW